MKKTALHIIFIFFIVLNSNAQQNNNKIELLQSKEEYFAGDDITLSFSKILDSVPNLYFSNSYGSIMINPITNNHKTTYIIPEYMSQKSGWNYWQLTHNHQNTKGRFYIHPIKKVNKIETYLGPPSIEVGDIDYAMFVTIPLDKYNNPMTKNTPVNIQQKHLNDYQQNTVPFNGMIAYKIINSHPKAGRTFVSSECLNETSKEYTLEIVPAGPTNFKIDSQRVHDYGDGNQITKFYTSIIKDRYENIVADGTAVTFRILNNKGMYLQTFGTTINGVATAQMVHPDHKDTWNIKAFVDGFSESNNITLTYKNAVQDFDIAFNTNNKTLTVGPFKSFMKQTLPDGLMVQLELFENDKISHKINLQTENGFAVFDLKTFIKKDKKYTASIKTAQINKQLDLN